MIKTDAELWAPTIRKLERHGLGKEDGIALSSLPMKVSDVKASSYLMKEGDQPTHCCILISGYVNRHKLSQNGSRQIISIHMAGDIIDLQQLLLKRADHNVQCLTAARVGTVAVEDIRKLTSASASIADALWRDSLVDASIFREWVLNVGRRDAAARIAHLLCEFGVRSEAAGLSTGGSFELPMTQEQLADATGMTTVHVNRTLKKLASLGLIERKMRSITVNDWQRLKQMADFRETYLHERPVPRVIAANGHDSRPAQNSHRSSL
jgi:CRP-like cAMP-binding protein